MPSRLGDGCLGRRSALPPPVLASPPQNDALYRTGSVVACVALVIAGIVVGIWAVVDGSE